MSPTEAPLRDPGTSKSVIGAKAPLDYRGQVPDLMEVIDLPPQDFLVFQGRPYSEDEMGEAISLVCRIAGPYQPEQIGWTWDMAACDTISLL